MDKNLIIQYTVVGIIILCALIWIIVRMLTKKDKGACSGCSLSANCNKIKEHSKHSPKKDTCNNK